MDGWKWKVVGTLLEESVVCGRSCPPPAQIILPRAFSSDGLARPELYLRLGCGLGDAHRSSSAFRDDYFLFLVVIFGIHLRLESNPPDAHTKIMADGCDKEER